MAVTLSDAAYGRLMWSLRHIACGYKHRKGASKPYRLLKSDMQYIARSVCEELNWSYSRNKIKKAAT